MNLNNIRLNEVAFFVENNGEIVGYRKSLQGLAAIIGVIPATLQYYKRKNMPMKERIGTMQTVDIFECLRWIYIDQNIPRITKDFDEVMATFLNEINRRHGDAGSTRIYQGLMQLFNKLKTDYNKAKNDKRTK